MISSSLKGTCSTPTSSALLRIVRSVINKSENYSFTTTIHCFLPSLAMSGPAVLLFATPKVTFLGSSAVLLFFFFYCCPSFAISLNSHYTLTLIDINDDDDHGRRLYWQPPSVLKSVTRRICIERGECFPAGLILVQGVTLWLLRCRCCCCRDWEILVNNTIHTERRLRHHLCPCQQPLTRYTLVYWQEQTAFIAGVV